jgi:polyhydroxyalkanoate synthesis repressor PhaR
MKKPRVIKKYPNRRLYDTVESRYITLADIRKLVLARIEAAVIDRTTQEDITRNILLQVIAGQEQAGEPLMSCDFFAEVIRSYGAMPGAVGTHLEQSMKRFLEQHSAACDLPECAAQVDAALEGGAVEGTTGHKGNGR